VIFCYWQGTDHDPIREAVHVWRSHFPDFQVLGDPDIEPLIARRFPRHLETYRKIRIPACKSDLARLLALHEWGGLYVDCHCGIHDINFIRRLLECLDTFELIVSYKNRTSDGWPPNKPHPTNSFIFAGKNSAIMTECATSAFRNLEAHWKTEKENGFCAYSIWSLVGAQILHDTVIDWDVEPPTLKSHLAQKIWVLPEDKAPIIRFMYSTYNKPGMHWSEREKHELLFD
jgi:mannosyltransferase OCH1-like enzyme